MGNACCSTTDNTDMDMGKSNFVGEDKSNVRTNLENEDFPRSNVATADTMNPPSTLARVPYSQRSDWTRIDDSNLTGNPRGGPFKYLGSNTTYEGQFKDGLRSGLGTEITADGEVYTGNWADDQRNGSGRLCEINGDVYEGEFRRGLRDGQGTIVHEESGFTYTGEWRNDKKDGRGVEIGEDFRYEGDFREGMKHGRGIWNLPGGGRFEGEFTRDQINGHGIYIFGQKSKKQRFEGNFKDGDFEGQGRLEKKNGDIYTGNFSRGKYQGQGTLFKPGRGEYTGPFEDGFMEGVFTVRKENGAIVREIFENNKKIGNA